MYHVEILNEILVRLLGILLSADDLGLRGLGTSIDLVIGSLIIFLTLMKGSDSMRWATQA